MNDPTLIGPCAEYEYEIVDLQDGGLPAGRARTVLAHLDGCPRCRAWAAELAALDTGLAATLPRPALSPDFDARLRERIASLSALNGRSELRTRLEREHDSLVESLRRGARRRAGLGAVGSSAVALGLLDAARTLLAPRADLLPLLGEGPERWIALGTVGAAIALAALAWSVSRGGMPGPGWGR